MLRRGSILRPWELACGRNVEKFRSDSCKLRLRDHSGEDLEDKKIPREMWTVAAWFKVFKSGTRTLSGTGLEFNLATF